MNRKSGSGSGPFLMEMLVVVGFFIFCTGICVQVFVKADYLSREARDMNQAVLIAESLAEELKAGQTGGMAGDMALAEGQLYEDQDMLPDREIEEHLMNADALLNPEQAKWAGELVDSEGYEGMDALYWDSRWQPSEPVPAPPYLAIVRRGVVDGMRRADILIMCYGNGIDKGKVLCRLQTETYEGPQRDGL